VGQREFGGETALAGRPGGLAALAMVLWRQPSLLLGFAALCWAINIIVGRATRDAVPPVALGFLRWAAAFVVILPLAWPHLRRDWPELKRRWRIVAVLSAFGIGGYNALAYVALHHTSAVNGSLLQSALPALTMIWGLLIFRDRQGALQLLGLAVSLAGVVVIITHGRPDELLALRLNLGDGLMIAALSLYGVYTVLLRLRPRVHPLSFLAATFALGTLFLAPVYLGERALGARVAWSLPVALALAFLAVFPSVVAYLCFNRGVELVGAARAAQHNHLIPAFGSLMAVVVLGEPFHFYHLAGIALIFAGIVLASRRRLGDKAP
jgi:drug/metabolite transporter (DMT)-like permease